MEGFYAKREELRGGFQRLVEERASEEAFIEFISSKFHHHSKSNKLDFVALEAFLDLSLCVVNSNNIDQQDEHQTSDEIGGSNLTSRQDKDDEHKESEDEIKKMSSEFYDADDERLDDTLIFPCHIMFDECHPELLQNYHSQHHNKLSSSFSTPSTQIVRHPRICEIVLDFLFENLRAQFLLNSKFKGYDVNFSNINREENFNDIDVDDEQSDSLSFEEDLSDYDHSISAFLDSTVIIVKRLNRVCSRERKNCRTLSKTRALDIVLDNTLFLLEKVPDKQHVYLEILLKFAFKLIDYKITGRNLKQLYAIIKNENADLAIVLSNLESLLDHHHRTLKNIHPLKSINFPTASKTAEEIQSSNFYVSNSWHWRLRSKVIEYKRKFSRTTESDISKLNSNITMKKQTNSTEDATNQLENTNDKDLVTSQENVNQSPPANSASSINKITPSWLECSIMTPLSSASSLIQNGQLKFCCSMWMSICGDLFVVDESKLKKMLTVSEDISKKDWRATKGHWIRLMSRKTSIRRYKEKLRSSKKTKRTRKLSFKLNQRKSSEEKDEEHDEAAECNPLNTLPRQQQIKLNRYRSFCSNNQNNKNQKSKPALDKSNSIKFKPKGQQLASELKLPKEGLNSRARDNLQAVLIHIISFAIDTLTIEIWLNIKRMTFCARVCRLAREGQTLLLDQKSFPSHLEANGDWSHIMFCLEESGSGNGKNYLEKTLRLEVCVNGTHREKEKLTYTLSNMNTPTNFACLIGCERSTFGYVWKLSQINIYREIPPDDVALFLLGKGPDFWSFTNFKQAASTLQLPDLTQRFARNLLNPLFLELYLSLDEERALNWLTQKVQLVYVAHQADYFLDYSTASLVSSLPADYESVNSSERFIRAKILNFSRGLKFNYNYGFGQALVEAGGIEGVLVCFADVIRRSHELSNVHSLAFSTLLKLSQTHQHHFNKLLDELNGLKLAEFLLAHPDCILTKSILDHYLEFCLIKKGEINLIKSHKLIYHLMSCWRTWHKDPLIARQLYRKLIRLLSPTDSSNRQLQLEQRKLESYYINYNFQMITRAGGIDILMSVLRECLVPLDDSSDDAPKLNHELVELIVNLISLLIKHPPGLDVMLDIMEFLLFLHPDHKSYVEVSVDSTSYLRPLHGAREEVNATSHYITDRIANRGFRTPLSDTSSVYGLSVDQMNDFRFMNDRQDFCRTNNDRISSPSSMIDGSAPTSITSNSSDEDGTNSVDFPIHSSSKCNNENLVKFIYRYNIPTTTPKCLPTLPEHELQLHWMKGDIQQEDVCFNLDGEQDEVNHDDEEKKQREEEEEEDEAEYEKEKERELLLLLEGNPTCKKKEDMNNNPVEKCSNRNFSIACIADMLASIVKLLATDPTKILSEALQKSIIDIRKMIILANNNSSLVREKVLRLFLYCIRACYSLNLKSILNKYKEDTVTPGSKFKTCTPIQLMARQLLKYPTSIKMIQLCYGIIVGIDDFETVDSFCLLFDIDTIDNNLQLNTFILLLNLMTQLTVPKELVTTLKFVNAYVQQLLHLGQDLIVQVLIEHNLIDNLMRIYFSYVEHEILKSFNYSDSYTSRIDEDDYDGEDDHGEVKKEADKTLLLLVKYFTQNLSSQDFIKCIADLLTYFDLLNSYVPSNFQYILRDRKVKILAASLSYCKLYEKSAKERSYGVKILYSLSNLLKRSTISNTFPNELSDSQLELNTSSLDDIDEKRLIYLTKFENNDENTYSSNASYCNNELIEADPIADDCSSGSQTIQEKNDIIEAKKITEYDVIERFKALFEMMVEFILTRETGVIPSPFERNFIIKCLKLLSTYLNECSNNLLSSSKAAQTKNKSQAKLKSLWHLILQKLETNIRLSFSRIILFLLSPCDSTNLDERKYYALKILDLFTPEQLLEYLEEDSEIATNRVLVVFIRELINFSNSSSVNTEDSSCEQDDSEMLAGDTESKLKILADNLEFQFELKNGNQQQQQLRHRISNSNYLVKHKQDKICVPFNTLDLETKLCNIWIAKLVEIKEEARDRSALLKAKTSRLNSLMSGNVNTADNNSTDTSDCKVLDKALQITREVVNDKHEQRKLYLEDIKQSKVFNYHVRQQWLSLIIGHTHERAIWYLQGYHPNSWELNPVEGPSRIRRRLRPCKLMLDSRFLRRKGSRNHGFTLGGSEVSQQQVRGVESARSSLQSDLFDAEDWFNHYSPHPLCSMVVNQEQSMDSNELRIRMFTTDRIHFNCDCSIIRPNEVCEGEVSIASWCIHFIGDRAEANKQQLAFTSPAAFRTRPPTSVSVFSNGATLDEDSVFDGKLSASSAITKCFYPSSSYSKRSATGARRFPSIARQEDLVSTTITRQSITNNNNTRVSSQQKDGRQSGHSGLTTSFASSTTSVEDLWFDEIVEIWDRRYQLQDVGLEIFLTNNMTYLFSFRNNKDREDFKQSLMREQHKMINLQRYNNLNTSLIRVTQLWRDEKLTNFDYLTCLNKLAGRSFNDLMQYPVFPFVLSNYTSETLDLTDPSSFRNLKRPMAVQNQEKEPIFLNNYQNSQSSNLSMSLCGLQAKPYHYGNHYSNSATVLHFLVRLPPFTQMLIQYQDNNFDQPDRTFHSVESTWRLITKDSNTDFKELIPEFFFLPEMFNNLEQFELGVKQNNEIVDDVIMPAWCPNSDARLFTLIHRQALESDYVSEHLHHWIDLIFGYKQTGKAAVEATNVFHPATYYGMIDLNSSSSSTGSTPMEGSTLSAYARVSSKNNSGSDTNHSSITFLNGTLNELTGSSSSSTNNNNNNNNNNIKKKKNRRAASLGSQYKAAQQQSTIERLALETMIKTYGQMPRQLFGQPTKQRFSHLQVPASYQAKQIPHLQIIEHQHQQRIVPIKERKMDPLRQVRGLKWGSFVGSPDELDITAVRHKQLPVNEFQHLKGRRANLNGNGSRSICDEAPQMKLQLCLLPNGDLAIMKDNCSLMLDYRADRKSIESNFQPNLTSSRYSRRAGLSSIARMNLFSNMIISRQQFGYLDPTTLSETASPSSSSLRLKFSPESLSLISWAFLDGTIRIKHSALLAGSKQNVPLVQADSIVDSASTCTSVPELNLLLVGYESGAICAHIISTSHETAPISQQFSATFSLNNLISSNTASPSTYATSNNNTNTNNNINDSSNSHTTSNSNNTTNDNNNSPSSLSAAPSAVHFLHTTTNSTSMLGTNGALGSGKVAKSSLTGLPFSALSLAGRTLQSVRSINKTTRWLYCHSKRINCMKINVNFGIVVTGSDDGSCVIWDLNSLIYVRTIDYKVSLSTSSANKSTAKSNFTKNLNVQGNKWDEQLNTDDDPTILSDYLCHCDHSYQSPTRIDRNIINRNQMERTREKGCICESGISLIAISDTLGDIVSTKDITDKIVEASEDDSSEQESSDSSYKKGVRMVNSRRSKYDPTANSKADSNKNNSSLSTILYCHTINGSLVGLINCHAQVTTVSYSNAPEGTSVNVIIIGLADGLIRLYSSWDLTRVKEFHVSGISSPISSILYTRDNKLLYVAYEDGQLVVLRNKKRKSTITMPKEWIL